MPPPQPIRPPTIPPKWLLAALGVLGLVLLLTHVRGAFLIDECNYMVTLSGLRAGQLTVPGTEGLVGSPELVYFDPAAASRGKLRLPVASTVPPLYAVLALPFSVFGWAGLVGLNVLSFLGCALLIFNYAGRHARKVHTPYLALVTFVLGGYCLEYAQGMWPQMLSLGIWMAGFVTASRVRGGAPPWVAALAGLLMGLAVGVRYPNLLLAAAVGLGVLIWSPRRIAASAAYVLGFSLPMAACSVMNYLRHGWWNPVSKGPYYFKFVGDKRRIRDYREPFHLLWARIMDFSSHPPTGFLKHARRPGSGGYLLHSSLKKALVQSCPWYLLALVPLVGSWRRGEAPPGGVGQRQELRAMSLCLAAMLGFYAWAGFLRRDGFCFNQRYLLELLPLAAVALSWAVEQVNLSRRWPLVVGAVLGLAVTVGLFRLSPYSTPRQLMLLKVPLLMSIVLTLVWVAARRGWLRGTFALLLGASLAWALGVHLFDDVLGARDVRARRGGTMREVSRVMDPDAPAAVFANWPSAVSMCPLHLTHDVVVLNVALDRRKHSRHLAHQLLDKGRKVYIYDDQFFPDKGVLHIVKGAPRKTLWRSGNRRVLEVKMIR